MSKPNPSQPVDIMKSSPSTGPNTEVMGSLTSASDPPHLVNAGTVKTPPSTSLNSGVTASLTSKSFFDFPAEIRNKIYHYMFQGKKMVVRGQAATLRNRSNGSNFLFASKRTLSEAKPVLLTLAIFDVEFNPKIARGPKSLPGFFGMEHTLIRKLEIPTTPYQGINVAKKVLTMPRLQSLTVQKGCLPPVLTTWLWRRMSLAQSCTFVIAVTHRVCRFTIEERKAILRHLRAVAQESMQSAQFLFRWHVRAGDIRTVNRNRFHSTTHG